MKPRTLAAQLEKLKPIEKGYLVWVLNGSNHLGYEVHLGMLPFVSVDDALEALSKYGGSTSTGKITSANVRAKLKAAYGIGGHVTWSIKLNDAKVVKRFGAHPERGHKIQGVSKKRVTCGVRWSLPKRRHVPDDDVLVAPHVTLHPATLPGWWNVTCETKYREKVTMYLVDHCQ